METIENLISRSYGMRQRYTKGDTVTFTAPHATGISSFTADGKWAGIDEASRLTKGQEYEGTISSISNAGFRGIEMGVTIDGRTYHGISMGAIK